VELVSLALGCGMPLELLFLLYRPHLLHINILIMHNILLLLLQIYFCFTLLLSYHSLSFLFVFSYVHFPVLCQCPLFLHPSSYLLPLCDRLRSSAIYIPFRDDLCFFNQWLVM
jgi:hypothetical protein